MTEAQLNRIYIFQGVITGISGLWLFIASRQQLFPFLAGACLITFNFFLLTALWKRVFDKKPVALTLGLIITKYAVLAVLLFVLVKKWSLQLIPLFAGLSTIAGSFVVLALQIYISEKKE